MKENLFDVSSLQTPCYVVDEQALIHNLEILQQVKQRTNCKILLAQKAFSMFSCYELIGKYLDGTTASGLYEARLGKEEMGKENHIFSPAYTQKEFDSILDICDHLIFNSFSQWQRFSGRAVAANKSCGIRINPECSTQEGHDIYDPCGFASRLGVTWEEFQPGLLEGIEGLHFHTLCEQNADALDTTLVAFEQHYSEYLYQMKWLNLGGGHHITRDDYDVELLISIINRLQDTYDLQVYLEPGEAVALNAGYLVTQVQDIVKNSMEIAILDASASCHMPDVLEMPYRPPLWNSGLPQEKEYTYRFGGPTCLAGDVIGDYSFDSPLEIGDYLFFQDMAIYTMVKNNTFNGMALPSIYYKKIDQRLELVKEFDYFDFKSRLS